MGESPEGNSGNGIEIIKWIFQQQDWRVSTLVMEIFISGNKGAGISILSNGPHWKSDHFKLIYFKWWSWH